MANIVISRIQNRRGRRENLPQPLLPGEVAVTSDTSQAWMGQDPTLAVPSINVYSDKVESTAQNIIDNNITEVRFAPGFNTTVFNTLVGDLLADGTITVTENDILWDSTSRGEILSVTVDVAGTGYTTGDVVTAVSSTGSGFIGTVVDNGGGGIASVTVTNGGQNYTTSTTFTIASGTLGELSLAATDLWGSTVHIAGNTSVDANNTITNIKAAVAAADGSVTALLSSTDTAGGWQYGDNSGFGGVDRTFASGSLIVDNHEEASNVISLINRVNSSSPGEITGLTYTNLNIELTTPPVNATFQLAGSDLTIALTTGTSVAYFRAPRSITLTEVRASLLTASTSGAVTIDINVNGSSILSTLLTIDQDEKTSVTAATPAVISTPTLTDDDEVTVDIDGAGTGAIGLIVTLIGIA